MRERHPRPPAERTERTRLVGADQLEQFYGHAEPPLRLQAVIMTGVASVSVMPALVAGIHVFLRHRVPRRGWPGQARVRRDGISAPSTSLPPRSARTTACALPRCGSPAGRNSD